MVEIIADIFLEVVLTIMKLYTEDVYSVTRPSAGRYS